MKALAEGARRTGEKRLDVWLRGSVGVHVWRESEPLGIAAYAVVGVASIHPPLSSMFA